MRAELGERMQLAMLLAGVALLMVAHVRQLRRRRGEPKALQSRKKMASQQAFERRAGHRRRAEESVQADSFG